MACGAIWINNDLILTPEYSINEVTMSGVMMYMGWPYYAWSAGYDTYDRAAKAKEIYNSTDAEAIKNLVKQEKITYVLYEAGMQYEQEACREDYDCQCVYTGLRIRRWENKDL